MSRVLAIALVILFGAGGCGRVYRFDLEVIVTNDTDGSPVAGATIHRNMWGEKTDPKTPETVIVTDASGRAGEQFSVPDSAFSSGKPTWYLRVSKEGFRTEAVEFKPTKLPADGSARLEVPIKLVPLKQ
jgi:hypothetical protein